MRKATHPNPPLSGRGHFCHKIGITGSSPDKGRLGGVIVPREKRNFIPYQFKLKEYARRNRKNPTVAEQATWRILNQKQFSNFKFVRQKPLDTFIADFYCSKLLLVIEIDGDTHANQKDYDDLRSDILKDRYGIDVIRFNNADVLHNIEEVYKQLLTKVQMIKR